MKTQLLRPAVICGVAALFCALSAHAAVPLRIMPLGDSITAGYTDNPSWSAHPFEFGYRSELYTLLTDAGYDFKFVGGSTEPWTGISGDPTRGGIYTPTLDLRALGQDGHRGYGGQTAGFLYNNIVNWLSTDDPDIILLHIGTNSQDTRALNNLVNRIVTTQPDAKLIIAEIIPNFTYNQQIVNYNAYVRDTLVPQYQAQGKHVFHVDQYANFLSNPSDLTSIAQALFSNGINHPSNPGYDRMARTWFEKIEAVAPPVPEPSTAMLLIPAALAIEGRGLKRRRRGATPQFSRRRLVRAEGVKPAQEGFRPSKQGWSR